MSRMILRPLEPGDREWVGQFTTERWGADHIVAHGEAFYPAELPGFIALE